MKTQEELNDLKEEIEALNKKLAVLTDEELAQVSGGVGHVVDELGLEVTGVMLDYSNSAYGP